MSGVTDERSRETAFTLWPRLPLTCEQRLRAAFRTDYPAAHDRARLGGHRATRKGWTNHAERLGRLVRRSLAFSRSDEMQGAGLTLPYHRYRASH